MPRLALTGDVMLGRVVNAVLADLPPQYPWGDTLELLRGADWRACNLECVIADRGSPWQATAKEFHFRSEAKNVAVLKTARIDAVSLANNHTLDFQAEALLEMLANLDCAGIAHAGAGANSDEAFRAASGEVAGTKLALVAFTDNEPEWEARRELPGVAYVPVDPEDERAGVLFQAIRAAKRESDLVIAAAHWGPNWGYEPPREQVRFARSLMEAGADLIFGHSGHVFRGIELLGEKPVIYCAGDFIDDYAVDDVERNDESFIFTVDVEGARIRRLRLYPTVIADCQARMAVGARAQVIARKMIKLCAAFKTAARWNSRERLVEISVG